MPRILEYRRIHFKFSVVFLINDVTVRYTFNHDITVDIEQKKAITLGFTFLIRVFSILEGGRVYRKKSMFHDR